MGLFRRSTSFAFPKRRGGSYCVFHLFLSAACRAFTTVLITLTRAWPHTRLHRGFGNSALTPVSYFFCMSAQTNGTRTALGCCEFSLVCASARPDGTSN